MITIKFITICESVFLLEYFFSFFNNNIKFLNFNKIKKILPKTAIRNDSNIFNKNAEE